MSKEKLEKWLKLVIIGLGIVGVFLYGIILPYFGESILSEAGGVWKSAFWPWMIFLWLTAVPCFLALFYAWKIAGRIGKESAFSKKSAKDMKRIGILAFGDSAFLMLGNIVLFLMNWNHPGMFLIFTLFVFVGVLIAVAAFVLSHLIYRAAELEEEAELTI
jgi:MFS family permease